MSILNRIKNIFLPRYARPAITSGVTSYRGEKPKRSKLRYPNNAGFRVDCPEVDKPFKSSMEANVYRYYRYIKFKHGKIDSVQYEPEKFVFRNNSYNIRAYIPDFKICSGKNYWYIETKGFMDDASRQKAKLISAQYPWIKLHFVGPKQYKKIQDLYAKYIPYWEYF